MDTNIQGKGGREINVTVKTIICFVLRENNCYWRGTEALLPLHGLHENFSFVLFFFLLLFLFQPVILPAYTEDPSMLLSYLETIFLCFSEVVEIKSNILTKTSGFCHIACWTLLYWDEWNSFSLLNLKRLVKFRKTRNYQFPPKLSKLNMIIFVKDLLRARMSKFRLFHFIMTQIL